MTRAAPRGQRPPIDWDDIHRRLASLQEAVDRGWAPGPGERQGILRARARALAQPLAPPAAAGDGLEVIEFLLGGERYGLETRYVREVFPMIELTPLPCVPDFVPGVVNVRGEIVSVIDLKRFFGLPETGLTDLNKVIVLQGRDMGFGVLADAVQGVRSLSSTELQAGLPTLTDVRQDYLRGIAGDRLVVLDAVRLLADRRLVVNDAVPD